MTSLADLIATAHVHRAQLGEQAAAKARKALLSAAGAAGALPSEVPADELFAAHEARKDVVGTTQCQEERMHLERLLALEPLPYTLANRVFRGDVTLADALAALELQPWSEKALRPRRSALKTVISALSTTRDGTDVPASKKALEHRLHRLNYTDLGVSKASIATIKSHVRRAAALVDLNTRHDLKQSMLSGDWAHLVTAIRARNTTRGRSYEAKIWPLIECCYRHGIEAQDVTDETVQELHADLARREIANPLERARATVYAWEAFQREIPGWPSTQLTRLYSHGSPANPTPFERLPAEFQEAWKDYEKTFFTDPSAKSGAPEKLSALVAGVDDSGYTDNFAHLRKAARSETPAVAGRSRTSAPNFRTVVTFAANAAIHDEGWEPTYLADLMNEDILNRTLKRRHVRQQQKADNNCEPRPSEISNTLRSTVTIFKSIANDLGIDKNSIEEFDRYYDFVHPDFLEWRNTKDGPKRSYQDRKIGPTHAKMLDAFAQDGGRQKLMAWFKFPKMLINKVRKELDRQDDVTALSDKRLGDAMTAVNAAILRCVPLRRYNLAKLRIKSCPQSGEPQTLRIPNETDRDARISIGPAEIKKNGKGIEVLLTPFATAVLRFYRDRIRPEIMRRRGSDPSNPYLFPGAGMQERWHSKHTRDYAKRAWDAGFWLDLHGNRHLTAKIVLDRDPGAMKLVQEVLGHKSEKTTRAYYAEVDELLAHKRFQEYLENAEHENLEELQAILRSVE